MSSISSIYRLSNCVISGYKTAIHGRSNLQTNIICNYSRKSAEDKLGINKPKRPLTPFFKFMSQMRPTLLAKNPGMTAKEAIQWSGKHWQQLDTEAKTQLAKEYEKDMEDFKKIKSLYEASLTDEQKEDIKRVKGEMEAVKEKRKLKAEYRELGRPKKPPSSYILFLLTKREQFKGKSPVELQGAIRSEWINLSPVEKSKYEKQAQDALKKYRKDMEQWELKMIAMDRPDLVKAKPSRARAPPKPKSEKKQ